MAAFTTSILVGYDYNEEKDNAVLIVGKKVSNEHVQIINAFDGEEAKALYKKLIGEKGE